jgi:hypothetical protein
MYMKINEVSSNRWSKTEMGGPQRPLWFYPLGRLNYPVEGQGAQLGVAPLLVGDWRQPIRRNRGGKVARGERATPKDVKNEGRSGDVYENKGPDDNLPDTDDDISARLHAILRKSTHILQKPPALLPLFEPWGTNPSLQLAYTFTRRNAKGFPPWRG